MAVVVVVALLVLLARQVQRDHQHIPAAVRAELARDEKLSGQARRRALGPYDGSSGLGPRWRPAHRA
jgi:hypothetical protein